MTVEVRPLIKMNTHVAPIFFDLKDAVIFEEFDFNDEFFFIYIDKEIFFN